MIIHKISYEDVQTVYGYCELLVQTAIQEAITIATYLKSTKQEIILNPSFKLTLPKKLRRRFQQKEDEFEIYISQSMDWFENDIKNELVNNSVIPLPNQLGETRLVTGESKESELHTDSEDKIYISQFENEENTELVNNSKLTSTCELLTKSVSNDNSLNESESEDEYEIYISQSMHWFERHSSKQDTELVNNSKLTSNSEIVPISTRKLSTESNKFELPSNTQKTSEDECEISESMGWLENELVENSNLTSNSKSLPMSTRKLSTESNKFESPPNTQNPSEDECEISESVSWLENDVKKELVNSLQPTYSCELLQKSGNTRKLSTESNKFEERLNTQQPFEDACKISESVSWFEKELVNNSKLTSSSELLPMTTSTRKLSTNESTKFDSPSYSHKSYIDDHGDMSSRVDNFPTTNTKEDQAQEEQEKSLVLEEELESESSQENKTINILNSSELNVNDSPQDTYYIDFSNSDGESYNVKFPDCETGYANPINVDALEKALLDIVENEKKKDETPEVKKINEISDKEKSCKVRFELEKPEIGHVKSLISKFEMESQKSSIFYIGDDNDSLNSDDVPVKLDNSVAQTGEETSHCEPRSAVIPEGTRSARCSRCLGAENVTTALSVLSFAGTLGNLLRLPRMVYFHGGGAFLLVYVLITLVFGIPLTFLEIGLGQFCQHGAVKLWRAVNLFRGVGYAKAFLSFALAVSFSTQVSSALALLVYTSYESQSFSDCDNMPSTENGSFVMAVSSQQSKQICLLQTVLAPATNQAMWFGIKVVFLILIWALVFICVMKRSVTYRRVMYFLFPGFFALIAALLVEGSNHPNNASTGLDKVFTFDWTALGDIQVWYFAIVQMFFSLQLGLGNISTCAGRIYPKSNAFWTALCLVGSSLVMGVASIILVYIWLGALDEQTPYDVPETFVLSVIYQLSASTAVIWPCLAYLLVLIAGISSLIPLIYTVLVAGAVETKRKWRWRHINASICLAACFFSAISLIPGKLTMAHILEHYLVSHGVVFLTFLELIGFAVVYGCSNLYNDLEFVIGSKLSSMWKSLWLVTPCVLLVVEICAICLLPLDSEAGQNSDPLWETCLGWALYFTCWMIVLISAFYQVCIQVDYNIAQKFVSALKPSRNWGPVDPIYRHCWVQWRNRYNLTGARDFTLKRRGTRDYTHHARTTPAKSDTGSLNWPQSRH